MEFLAVLKPDGVIRRGPGANILKGIMESGLCEFASFAEVRVPTSLLDIHYSHVMTRAFYPWLVKYMSDGPSFVVLLEGNPASISELRDLLGATRAHLASPNTLRYKYTPYGGANGLHLSENEEAAKFETELWKQTLGVSSGQFDMPVEQYIDKYLASPNNTLPLREICLQIEADGRPPKEANLARMKELLLGECIDATEKDVDFLTWVLSEVALV